jgi:AraC-like DNA-binding protein
LGDPDLDPAKIACAMGISVRNLHAIFQSGGESVGDCLRRLRLARAYDALVSAARDQVAVKEIAYKYGFRNPAHFATAFKSRFGVSPSEIRRDARTAA